MVPLARRPTRRLVSPSSDHGHTGLRPGSGQGSHDWFAGCGVGRTGACSPLFPPLSSSSSSCGADAPSGRKEGWSLGRRCLGQLSESCGGFDLGIVALARMRPRGSLWECFSRRIDRSSPFLVQPCMGRGYKVLCWDSVSLKQNRCFISRSLMSFHLHDTVRAHC